MKQEMALPTVARVGALYDIHANIAAFEAVVDVLHASAVDCIVYGGDLALGPFPRQLMDTVMAAGPSTRFIRGNCDRLVVDAFHGRDLSRLPERVRHLVEWTAGQLDDRHRDFLEALPTSVTLNVGGMGNVLFCHATTRSDDEIFTVRTPDDRVRPMLGDAPPRTIVCGHTHMQFDRSLGETRILNAGSVGMPYGGTGAHWLLLGPDVKFMHTPYDLALAAERVRASGYPDAEEFAQRNVLKPISEEQALQILEPGSSR